MNLNQFALKPIVVEINVINNRSQWLPGIVWCMSVEACGWGSVAVGAVGVAGVPCGPTKVVGLLLPPGALACKFGVGSCGLFDV